MGESQREWLVSSFIVWLKRHIHVPLLSYGHKQVFDFSQSDTEEIVFLE